MDIGEIKREIIKELSWFKIPVSKIEKDLGFSNGLLKKENLSYFKFIELCKYYSSFFLKCNYDHTFYVYRIINPMTNHPFYVGMTRQLPEIRLSSHIGECCYFVGKTFNKKQNIIRQILDEGKRPIIEVVEQIVNPVFYDGLSLALKKETQTQMLYVQQGYDIANQIYKKNIVVDSLSGEKNKTLKNVAKEIDNFNNILEKCGFQKIIDFGEDKFLNIEKYTVYKESDRPTGKYNQAIWIKNKKKHDDAIREQWKIFSQREDRDYVQNETIR